MPTRSRLRAAEDVGLGNDACSSYCAVMAHGINQAMPARPGDCLAIPPRVSTGHVQ